MTFRPRVRALRPRLILVTAAGSALVLVLLTLAFNVVLDARLNRSLDDLLHQRASAHLATLGTNGRTLQVPEAPDAGAVDTPIWVFSGRRVLERPVAPAADQRAALALAGGPRRMLEVGATDTRLYAVPVSAGGRRLGTLVAAASLVPYERTARTALTASIVFALVALGAIVLAARWAIGAALRPVAQMTTQAERSSVSDLDRRFSTGEPYDEVTHLAATFDRLLARLSAALRRERSFSAEVSHELRTPLAKLVAEADLALRRERRPDEYRRALAAIRREAADVTRTLETLLLAARADSGGERSVSDARDAARAVSRSLQDQADECGVEIEVDVPDGPVPVGADSAAVERLLAPLVENACRYAERKVRVGVSRVDGEVRLHVEDDGPGVDAAIHDRLFEAGVRTQNRSDEHVGAGLGLALTRRLARALDGDVEYVAPNGRPGAAFRVRLPAV